MLVKDGIVIAEGRLAQDERTGKAVLRLARLSSLEQERARHASGICLDLDAEQADDRMREFLRATLAATPGDCAVRLRYRQRGQSATLALGPRWRVAPSEALLEALRRELGRDKVNIEFATVPAPASTEAV